MKRTLDILVSFCALVILSPLLLLVGVFVAKKLGKPVLFSQDRPGLGGRIYRMYKFRSMSDARSDDGELLPDSQRLNRFGALLRSSSLDELPALWNVLVGEMSLVGPRPLLVEYLPLYSVEQARRHEVKPGITGWAQVNGRNTLSWNEKFALDVWYVDNKSVWLDLKILFLTINKVWAREGISSGGSVTMEKFKG